MDGVRLAHSTSLRKGDTKADVVVETSSDCINNIVADTCDEEEEPGHTTAHVWRSERRTSADLVRRRRSEDAQAAALLGQGVWDEWNCDDNEIAIQSGNEDSDQDQSNGRVELHGGNAPAVASRVYHRLTYVNGLSEKGSWRGVGSRIKRGSASAMSSDSVEDALRLHALTLSARAAAAAAAAKESDELAVQLSSTSIINGITSTTTTNDELLVDNLDQEDIKPSTTNPSLGPIVTKPKTTAAFARSSSPSVSSPNWNSMPFTVRNAPLLRVIPKFYGVTHADGRILLELEDLARWYRHPCIMDIKIGHRTWYANAAPDYIDRCKRKDAATTQAALGFKICGMQVYRHARGGYWRASKRWCKTLPEVLVDKALMSFAHNEHGLRPADVYGGPSGVVAQLRALESWFEMQEEFHLYSASLLFLYEGDAEGAEGGGRTRLAARYVKGAA